MSTANNTGAPAGSAWRKGILYGAALLAVLALAWSWATRNPAGLSLRALAEAAGQGYVFGYPLVLMDATRAAAAASGIPANTLHHVRRLPGAGFTAVVRPNTDTLYSIAWLDLAPGPQLLVVPPMPGRYWLFQGLDAWSNVMADAGVRTAGDTGGRFLFVGPDEAEGEWAGSLPGDVTVYRSPTRRVWLLGRIEVDGAADFGAVHALQDSVALRPFAPREVPGLQPPLVPVLDQRPGHGVAEPPAHSVPSGPPGPSGDEGLSPPERLRSMQPGVYFTHLARLLADNPPAAGDRPALEQLAGIAVTPGSAVDLSGFGPLARAAIRRGVEVARERLAAGPPRQSGWMTPEPHIGRYGTDYAYRAGVARYGLGANLPEDALYPSTATDAAGAPLLAGRAYRIRFAPGQPPPVNGFWSITLYDAAGYLVANAAQRYTVSSRDALVTDADGGITLDIHPGPPLSGRETNWLPTPTEGSFNVLGRLYWPQELALSGDWTMPPVERVE